MWKKSRLESGEETGRKLLGDKWDLIIEALSSQNQDITKYIVEWGYGEIYNRPQLDFKAREIIDSRGNPTVECDILFEENSFGRASVPSGASTGIHEALELRDQDKSKYKGKGVTQAVKNVNETIYNNVIGKEFLNINEFDDLLLQIDGTENKSNLGANAMLSASFVPSKFCC